MKYRIRFRTGLNLWHDTAKLPSKNNVWLSRGDEFYMRVFQSDGGHGWRAAFEAQSIKTKQLWMRSQ